MLMLLLALIPDAFLVLAIVGLGIAVIVGAVRLRAAFAMIGLLALMVMAAPFVEALFAALPFWIIGCVIIGVGIWIMRTVLESTLGSHAAGHVIGTAFVGVVKMLFGIVLLPVRLIARFLLTR